MSLDDEQEQVLLAKMKELRQELASLKDSTVSKETLATRLQAKNEFIAQLEKKSTEMDAQFSDFKSKSGTDLLLSDSGVKSADARSLLLHRYNQLPEDNRPAIESWVGDEGGARKDSLVSHVFSKEQANSNGRTREAPSPVESSKDEAVRFTPDIINGLTSEERMKHHDQIIKDLGF